MKKTLLCLALVAMLAACSSSKPPVVREVPAEALNPAVTPENVQKTACVPAYAASVAPPEAAQRSLMTELMQRAGIDVALSGTYVLDHRVPLRLGGHPTNRANLQLLEWSGPRGPSARKQALERRLWQLVCEGKLGLREAQAALYAEWDSAYTRYVEGSER